MQLSVTRRGLTSALTLAAIVFLALANSSNPPNGRTGAPGDGLCSDCHSQSNPPQDGDLQIDGFPASIVPNSNYTLTVTVSNPNGLAIRGGFQMVVLNSSDQNTGDLSNPSSSSVVTTSGGREYHEHNPAKNFGTGTEVSWTVDWTSPSGPDMEQVTAYAAGIVGNGMGGNSGDRLVTTTESGSLSGSALEIDVVSDPVLCFGGADGAVSVNVEGGTPGYTYLWSTGSTMQTVMGLEAGTYSVTVTDAQASTAEGEVEVMEPFELDAELTVQVPPSCTGDSDGSITAQGSGGTPGYTYMWSNGGSGSGIDNLPAGTYSVTITDNNGCSAETSTTLTDPDPLVVDLVGTVNPSCEGSADGIIEVAGGGGSFPYTYIWSNGATGSTIDQLPEGTYTVTVSDFNSCTVEETFVLVAGASIIAITSEVIQNVSCAGESDGSIMIEATGQGALQYSWSNGSIGSAITGLSAGVYSVTISDDSGCSLERTYDILEGDEIVLNFSGDNSVTCFGDMDADIAVAAMGGTPPYTYMWSEGDGSNLGPGLYTVTATDADGCTASGSIEITEPDQLSVLMEVVDESAFEANDGAVTATVSNAVLPLTYAWSNGETSIPTIDGLSPGMYCVTVTDANGCQASQCATVNTFGCSLATDVEFADVSCFGVDDGTALVTWEGANGDVSINWSTGDTTAQIAGLSPGTYSVIVTDTAQCVSQENITIAEPNEIMFDLVYDSLVCTGDQVDVMATQGFSEYIWSDGQTGSAVVVLPGDYCVTVVDENGCSADTCFTIEVSPPMEVVTDSIHEINDVGGGYFGISVSGGTPPLSYEWYSGDTLYSTEEDIQIADEGTYHVIVIDAVGCVAFGDTLFFQAGVAVTNVAEQIGLTISPNPASDILRVRMSDGVRISDVAVFNASGGRVSSYNVKHRFTGSIDVSSYPKGVYYAAFRTDKGLAVVKFIKL